MTGIYIHFVDNQLTMLYLDIFLAIQHDQTAADLAKEHGNKEIIKLLEDPQKAKEVSQ